MFYIWDKYDNEFEKKSNAKWNTLLLKWTGGQIQKAYDNHNLRSSTFCLIRLYSKNIIADRLSAHTKVEKVTNSFKNSDTTYI